jgi:hypothetical protein
LGLGRLATAGGWPPLVLAGRAHELHALGGFVAPFLLGPTRRGPAMRKIVSLVLVVVFSLAGLGACGDDDASCVPSCSGRECGWDPICGTQACGTCPMDRPTCSAATGLCSGVICTPNCTGRECGNDGCDGTCAPGCPAGQTCTAAGACLGGTGDACSITGDCVTGLSCATNAHWCARDCSTDADCAGVGLGGRNTTNGFVNYCIDVDGTGVCGLGACKCRPSCSTASDCSAYGFNVCSIMWTATVSQYVCAAP